MSSTQTTPLKKTAVLKSGARTSKKLPAVSKVDVVLPNAHAGPGRQATWDTIMTTAQTAPGTAIGLMTLREALSARHSFRTKAARTTPRPITTTTVSAAKSTRANA